MKGKERIMTALSRGQPDVVPVWELAFNEESVIKLARHLLPPRELPAPKHFLEMNDTEALQMVSAFADMGKSLGLDGFGASTMAPVTRVDTEHFRDAFGVIQHASRFGEPYPVQGPISDAADLKRYKMRSPEDGDFLLIDILRSQFPEQAVAYMLSGPFFLSWSLRGSLQNLLADYIENPDLAQDLARMVTDYDLAALEVIKKKGADFVVMECDLAFINNTMMSLKHYDQFVSPYHRQIVRRGHELGLKMVKHSDGKVQGLVPRFIEEGFDGLHPVQPQCMDIGETKRQYGDKICIMGNIDCAYLLVSGAPEQVRESVKKTIAAAAPGGGYIISSSNTIHPGCRPENYVALVQAAREFGKYPIAIK